MALSKYPVVEVDGFGIATIEKRTYYRVVYKSDEGVIERAAQPLETLMDCPLLMVDYELKRFKELVRSCRTGVRQRLGFRMKKHFPLKWTKTLRCDVAQEYIPNGRERLQEIKGSFEKSVKNELDEFYKVTFEFSDKDSFVRRVFMEYYFPIDLLCYWKLNNLQGPEFCIVLSDEEKQARLKRQNDKTRATKAKKGVRAKQRVKRTKKASVSTAGPHTRSKTSVK